LRFLRGVVGVVVLVYNDGPMGSGRVEWFAVWITANTSAMITSTPATPAAPIAPLV
jgi:hypothetical protein